MKNSEIIVFNQDNIDHKITFENRNGQVMINATQLAKPFNKLVGNFLRLDGTKNLISELKTHYSEVNNGKFDILYTIQGGNEKNKQGTWMCEELALKFAAWLSPSFDMWVQIHIKRLIKTGKTSLNDNGILPIQAHLDEQVQKDNSKSVNGKIYRKQDNKQRGVLNLINYNRKSSLLHTGLTPKQLKKIGKDIGLNTKQTSSGKQVLRNIRPSLACAMSLTDNIIANSSNLDHNDLERISKTSLKGLDFFQALIDEGITPYELKDNN